MFDWIESAYSSHPIKTSIVVFWLPLAAIVGVMGGFDYLESHDMSGTYRAEGLTVRLDPDWAVGLSDEPERSEFYHWQAWVSPLTVEKLKRLNPFTRDDYLPEGFTGHIIVGTKSFDLVATSSLRGQIEGQYFVDGANHPFEILYSYINPSEDDQPPIALVRGNSELALERIDNIPNSGFLGYWRAGDATLGGDHREGTSQAMLFIDGDGRKKILRLTSSGNAIRGIATSAGRDKSKTERVLGAYNPLTSTLGLGIGGAHYEFYRIPRAFAPSEPIWWRRMVGKFETPSGYRLRLQIIDEKREGKWTGEWSCEGEYTRPATAQQLDSGYDISERETEFKIMDCWVNTAGQFTLVYFEDAGFKAFAHINNTDTGGIVIAWNDTAFDNGLFLERVNKPLLRGLYASADGSLSVRLDSLIGDKWQGELTDSQGQTMAIVGRFSGDELRGIAQRPGGRTPIRMISSIDSMIFQSGVGYAMSETRLWLVSSSPRQPH